ncbi:hypothetical protein CI789_02860 [Erwinia persicina]|uniref:hypothetical protein n=1 Tax=Erwinia persicina TaxID=55211 RepID=UPI000E46C416|nr:hypothetical protein [Erwinia persicina]AXU94260.1 hypothetical protein CI789_02860 [Erwinia persicina]
MGFPSPAKDYIEPRIDLNAIFIRHPAATKLVGYDGMTYIVDAAIKPRDGSTICYEWLGEHGIGKLMGVSVITPDGESIEGEALAELTVIGTVVAAVVHLHDGNESII